MMANILEFFTESSGYTQVKKSNAKELLQVISFFYTSVHNSYLLLLLIACMCK